MFRGLFIRKLKDFAEDTRKDAKKTLLERFALDESSVSPSLMNESKAEDPKKLLEV